MSSVDLWPLVLAGHFEGRRVPWAAVLRYIGGLMDAPALWFGAHCANDEPYGFRVGDELRPAGPLQWPPPNPWRTAP